MATTDADRPDPVGTGDARIVVIGEALVDVVHRLDGRIEEMPGGSPANVALTLGRLGHRPQLVTQLADDRHGRVVRAWLDESGVELVASASPRTSTATAFLDAAGAASYEFDLDWDIAIAPQEVIDVLHSGSIAALLEPGATEVVRAMGEARHDALVTYDPNVRPALLGDRGPVRERVERVVALSDLVKASDEDLEWLYPESSAVEVARAWQATGPAVVIVTSGADGAFAVTAHGVWEVAAPRIRVADTVGAGDTFMAALIDVLLRLGISGAEGRDRLHRIGSSELTGMLERAALAAAITVSRPGADPPNARELADAEDARDAASTDRATD